MGMMSGRADARRRSFHQACARAVKACLGPAWSKWNPGWEPWTARFQRWTGTVAHVLSLRLAQKRHVVEIILAAKRDPSGPMPGIWWEDRSLHPEATAFAKVIWSGELTYGSERSIRVPREPWSPEFAIAVREQLAALRGAMESWYAEAESSIAKGGA